MRQLIDSVTATRDVKIAKKLGGGVKEVPDIKGLRDRAVIAIMAYTFARVSAVARLKRQDYRIEGKRARLLEKGNKEKSSGCITRRNSFSTPGWRKRI
jgi:site-specific recombinase XerD